VGDSPIVDAKTDTVVGLVTTAAKGARTNQTIARCFLNDPSKAPEQDLVVDCLGHRWVAEIFEPMR